MSKPTGTVPKAKKRPNPSAQFNNDEQTPLLWPPVNNLQATDWHPARQSNSHRDPPSSTDFAEQLAVAFIATEGASGSRGTRQSTPLMSTPGSQSFPRGRDHQSPSDLEADIRTNGIDHQHRYSDGGANALIDTTKNNFSRIPDRNQVLSRLNQIRDYVKQTSALMDSLNGSTDLNHLAQAVRLSRMQSELQESEKKLVQMLAVIPPNDEELTNGNASPHSFSSGAIPKVRDQNQLAVNQQQSRRRMSSSEERSPGPTPAQYAKHQELKLKVEESQKKLQALVQHQAALISLQEKAQQQLRDPNSLSQEFMRNWTDRADSLTGQFQELSTNEVVSLLGEQDKELDAEFMAIQERLQEIHDRKRTVDRLNRDMQQAIQLTPRENHLSTSSEEEEVEPEAASYVDVDAKVEELNSMKARLANLQSLVAAINRGEMPYDSVKSALSSNETDSRRDHSSRSSSSKPDNIFRNADAHQKSLDDQALEIRHKAQQLDKAKQKLQQLKEILNSAGIAEDEQDGDESVNSYSSTGRNADQQIPNQELELLMRTYLQQPKAETPSPSVPQRKNKNIKQDLVNIVHDPSGSSQKAYIQAKRQELEEMMRKDQGQSSAVNQDTCNASGLSVSDTGATWGGSMISAIPSQSEQQPSINCSSEELVWETDLMGPNVGISTPRFHGLTPSAFRQVQNAQKSPAASKPQIWPEPPMESSTPIYDVPPRSGSSTATPRPMGDEASPHAHWWLLQQQLEASNATCQSMMQQWQWGSPSPDSWWISSPIASQMMTTLSQCCQMLWMQQREIMNLHATLQSMQERMVCSEQNLSGPFQPPFNNSADANAAVTVTGAHSLPNLCEGLPQFIIPPNAFPWPPTQAPNNASAMPTLIRHGPPVTLNNQVPPGVRANNYWDNFRSYSRQNLLSTNTKVNDGQIQHPSPLTDRSHNSLRNNGESLPSPSRTAPQQQQPRKQKLNSERPPVSHQSPFIPPHTSSVNSPAEQLFSELASLVAQNQSRPEFLPQLFRELKTLRGNSDCQRVLNSIREIGRQEELLNIEEASNNRSDTPEGAAALPIKSPQRQVNENQVDTKIQSLLLQLMPFLKSKREDCCTPALLEVIIQRTLSHVTITQTPALNSFVQGQLHGRLVEALAKFQGCWLRDVGEELLATVAEVLLKELAFFKLLENVAHTEQGAASSLLANVQVDVQMNNCDPLSPDDQMDSSDSEIGEAAVPPTPPQRNCWLPPSMREATKAALEAKAEAVEVDLCDADLAEADQSHEVAVQESDGRGSQAEGTDTPDMGRQLDSLETITLSVEQQPNRNDDVWQVEQDRELDQVPSRLEPGDASVPPGPPTGQS